MSEHPVLAVTPDAVLDAVGRAVIATDPDGRILYWNRGAQLLYGWATEEVVGRNLDDVLVAEASETDGQWSGDLAVRHKDGHVLRVASVERSVHDDEGRVVAIVAASEDVSTERRLAHELRSTRDEQRLALAAGRLGILRWDRATTHVTLDETAEALLGLEPGRFDGRFSTWVATLHPEDRDRVRSMLDRAVERKGAYDLEYRVVWPDGSVHWLQGRGQVTVDDEGQVTGRIGCMADITARRVADEERAHLLAVERATRTEAETVATRLRGLQAVTMSLIRAVDARSVAEAVLQEGVPAVGGVNGSICMLADDANTVEIVLEVGYDDDVKQRWASFPLDAGVPASEAIRSGEMVLLNGPADRDDRYPALRGNPMRGAVAHAVVPLIDEDGIAFGAMAIGFPDPRSFNDGERRVLSALGAQAATALRRAALYEEAAAAAAAEREARLAAESARERLAFLAEASSELASSVLDLETTLARTVDLAVPRLAEGCAIHLVDQRGEAQPVAATHVRPDRLEELHRRADIRDAAGCGAVARTSVSEVRSGLAILPLRSQSRTLGTLTLAGAPGWQIDPADLQLAEQLAMRAATAIENARLFAERSRVARSLQASLLPPGLPTVANLELGARYAPAGEGVEVGGDFYDAFGLDGGRWLLVVGDVRGKGVDAAAVTGLARHTIRSIALYESEPKAILGHLNRVLLAAEADRVAALQSCDDPPWELTEPRFCTVALAIVTPGADGAHVVVCSGGHPLPLVARVDGTVEPVGRPGTLLGASPEIDLSDADVHLAPGESLVCFTDGIVERHDGRHFFDESGVAAAVRVAMAAGLDAAAIATSVEQGARTLFAGSPHDDMAVLVARVPSR